MLSIKDLQVGQLSYKINLKVKPGEQIGIIGDSGIGKSRLLKKIADLEMFEGTIMLNNVPNYDIEPTVWRKKISYLAAESQWWFEQVSDHFERVNEAFLNQLNLNSSILSKNAQSLSTGEKQRLALLRLLNQTTPEFLLLDEPTSALDNENTDLIEKFILELVNKNNLGVIWVSHDQNQIKRICHRYFIMTQKNFIQKNTL